MLIPFLEEEYWYGSCVKYGMKMPFHRDMSEEIDFTYNPTPNQAMPLLLSSKGRMIWRNKGFNAIFKDGTIQLPDDCELKKVGNTLKEAYLYAQQHYFSFHVSGPAKELFEGVIYNTWIELTFFQNQKDVMKYAQGILEAGMPAGVLMIDDGWSEYYGDWKFHCGKFQNPKQMVEELHKMGFQVMLWVCPYISADTVKFREAEKLGILITNPDGKPYIAGWWNGYSAVLDFSNPHAAQWLKNQLEELKDLGVDGFKFDAGDSVYYREDNKTYRPVSPDEQSRLWAEFGEQYSFNEFRVTFGAGGYGLFQRLCDKEHSWKETGVASLIPDTLLQGITGHPYSCPDLIGGGEYLNFQDMVSSDLDEELFVRHCEIACLMPAVQFSALPSRVLSKENFACILRSIQVRKKYLTYILKLLEDIPKTGEPVIRYMEYEFPGQGMEKIIDQFMLGDRYLVAPVYEKGKEGRTVYLPRGNWKRGDEETLSEGVALYIHSVLGEPIIFERAEA